MIFINQIHGRTVLLALFLAFCGLNGFAAELGTLTVHVSGMRSTKGKVRWMLFNTDSGFPEDASKAFKKDTNGESIVPSGSEIRCQFNIENVPFGQYALAIIADENGDGILNRSASKMFWFLSAAKHPPIEPYGFSNDIVAFYRAPSFQRALFRINQPKQSINVTLRIHPHAND